MSEVIERLKAESVDKQITKAFQGALALSIQNRSAHTLDEVTEAIEAQSVSKAMDTAEVGGGKEFVMTGFSVNVINAVRQTLRASSVFRHIPMPTPSYKVPVQLGPATAYLTPENTADTGQTSVTASQPGTTGLTLDSVSIAALTRVSKELTQDSVVPMIPFIQDSLLRGLAEGVEDAIFNGDVTATHMDTGVSGATNIKKAWPGLRKLCLANNWKVDLGTYSLSTLRDMITMMDIYGMNPDDLVLFMSNKAYQKTKSFTEVVTLDKYGPNATVLTGELARIDGIPIVTTSKLSAGYDNTGIVSATPGNNTKSAIILAHRDAFVLGDRQTVGLEQESAPIEYRQTKILADQRLAFKNVFDMTTQPTAVIGYNIG